MDIVDGLKRLKDAINSKGNSHNPEYWQAAEIIGDAADRLEKGRSDPVDEVKRAYDESIEHEGTRVKEPANNTIIAVLTEKADGVRCNGCGEMSQMDKDGYCWNCRVLYDRKP